MEYRPARQAAGLRRPPRAPNNLVARNDGHLRMRQFAVDNMKVRAADAARAHFYANLVRTRFPVGELGPFERTANLVQHHCMHRFLRLHELGRSLTRFYVRQLCKD